MSSWLLALRVARREARRAKGRSALVVALIALPVALLGFAAVAYDSFRLTGHQELDRELGTADAELRWISDAPVEQPVTGNGYSSAGDGDASRSAPATAADFADVLPPEDRVVPVPTDERTMATSGGVGQLGLEGADLTDPVHEGRIVLRQGEAPEPGEAALTRRAADRLGAGIGDTVHTADESTRWEVVGIVEFPADFHEQIVVHPDALPDAEIGDWYLASSEPVTWDRVRELNTHGITVVSRAVILDPPPDSAQYATWRNFGVDDSVAQDLSLGAVVLALGVFETVLLAGPAFAVSTRRRQRELAMTAVSGATPAQVRRVVLADGVVLGALGALVGLALAVATAAGALPLLEEQLFGNRSGGLGLWPPVLAGLAGVAVLTGVLAALVPAATVARLDVVQALAGLRGATGSRRRWLVVGLVLLGGGTAVAGAGAWLVDPRVLAGGLIVAQLGLVLCTPRIIGLVARAGRFVPLAPRVALRDTARNRAAAAPAISAVMAAVAGAVAVGMYGFSADTRSEEQYAPSAPYGYAWVEHPHEEELPDSGRAQVRQALAELPTAESVVELAGPSCLPEEREDYWCRLSVPRPPEKECPVERPLGGEPTEAQRDRMREDERCDNRIWSAGYGQVVTDGDHIGALTDVSADEAARARDVLADGGIVVLDSRLVADGEATVEVTREDREAVAGHEASRGQEFTVPAYALTTAAVESPLTHFLSPELVAEAGLATTPARTVAVTEAAPAQEDVDAVREKLEPVHDRLYVGVETGHPNDGPFLLVLAAVAGAVALGAAAIATGLAAADRRPDLATLGAVGASPQVRRRLSLSQSGVIAGMGAVLGTVAGLGTGAAVIAMTNQNLLDTTLVPYLYPMVVPWQVLGVLAVVPVVAMLGAGLLTRSRLPVERRTT